MPGIVTIITRMRWEDAERQLMRMLEAMDRGPHCTEGTWIDAAAGIYVGWVALRGSFAEAMPLRSERGETVLVFSGEEFPVPGTPERLKRQGHELDTEGAAYLVHLCKDDKSFPAGLNGRFHGIAIDRAAGTATIFNDRFGMHRICYHAAKDAFYFAAEAKSILAVRPELRRLDAQGLGEFISCGAVLENRTLFEGIQVLPPASAWKFANGVLQDRTSYFRPAEWEEQETLDPEAYYQQLRSVFAENLPRYFPGRQPIGMSLTGGLDTRMILACRNPEPGTLPCYTFGSMYRENQDVRVARRLAALYGQSHQVLVAGQEFLAQFGSYAERTVRITEGRVDVSRAPDLYLNEKARQLAPVRMTGNYGGEILRKVRAFKPVSPAPGWCTPEVIDQVRRAEQTYDRIIAGHPVSFAAFRQGPWYLHGVLALEESQLTMRSPYLDNDFIRTVFRSPAAALASNDVCLRLIGDHHRALLDVPTDRGVGGNRSRMAETLSHSALEFLFRAEYAYDMGMPPALARLDHALSFFHLERLFLGRHKPFHFRIWYKRELSEYVREMLLDARSLSRAHIEPKGVRAMIRGHLKGTHNATTEIHKLLTLELLHRLFLDQAGTGDAQTHREIPVAAELAQ